MSIDSSTTEEYKVIGKRGTKRFDIPIKVSGSATFTTDVSLPNQLYAKFVHCPYAHAKAKSFDISKAKSLPGVRDIITYEDPEIKAMPIAGAGTQAIDLSSPECHWEGEELGIIVAADTEEICEEAINLINIDWEELPFVLTIEEAIGGNAPIVYPERNPDNNVMFDWRIETGNIDEGFKQADITFEDEYKLHPLHHAGAETQVCLVQWIGDTVKIWTNVQIPDLKRSEIATALGVPLSKVSLEVNFKGGSFGQEATLTSACPRLNPYLGLLAKRTGRPVKYVYTRREHFYCAEPGLYAKVKVGIKNNGEITAIHMNAVGSGNVGGQADAWKSWGGLFSLWVREDLKCPNILDESSFVFVNKCPTWWFRCEENENAFIFASIIDRTAEITKLDPEEVIRLNARVNNSSCINVIKAGKEAISWDNKCHEPGKKILSNGKMHGLGMVWCHEWASVKGAYRPAAMRIETDGTVKLLSDTIDCGQCPNTTYAMIVAEVLGVKLDNVFMPQNNTNVGVPMQWPGGSTGCTRNGESWKACAIEARKQIFARAAPRLGVTPDELDMSDGTIFVKDNPEKSLPLRTSGISGLTVAVNPTDRPIGWGGNPLAYVEIPAPTVFQAHFVEVEVDPDTGKIEVTNVINVCDVGQAIRPESVEGQMYGGTIMAWGRPLSEDMIYDPQTGILLNGDLCNFQIASFLDCGPIETIIQESRLGIGPFGLAGVGEDTATLVPVGITNAVFNAIGVRIQENPITSEKILKALGKI
jgi:xanthine dehydrogenase molybdenum-binding subunit